MRLEKIVTTAVCVMAMTAGVLGQTTPPKAAPKATAAPDASQTATQAYLAYRAAFDKATKMEDLIPFQTAAMVKQMMATPVAQRPQMFGMMKMLNTMTGVKVTKETRTATGATLAVEGIDSDKAKQMGTVEMTKEGGAWKIGSESFHN